MLFAGLVKVKKKKLLERSLDSIIITTISNQKNLVNPHEEMKRSDPVTAPWLDNHEVSSFTSFAIPLTKEVWARLSHHHPESRTNVFEKAP